jgi:hypothetical protein
MRDIRRVAASTPKRVERERNTLDRIVNPEGMGGTAALLGASLTPGVSTAVDVASALNAITNRDALGLGISAFGLLPFISGTMVRTGGEGARRGIRSLADIKGVQRVLLPEGIPRTPYGRGRIERFRVQTSKPKPYDQFGFTVEESPLDHTVAEILQEVADARELDIDRGLDFFDDNTVQSIRDLAHRVRGRDLDEDTIRMIRRTFQTDPFNRNFSIVEKNLLDVVDDRLPQLRKQGIQGTPPRLAFNRTTNLPKEVDLSVTIPPDRPDPLKDMIGGRGLRSLGRAVIEDFEEVRPLRVKDLLGFRVTGTHGSRYDKFPSDLGRDMAEPYHLMRLPRSFFFKQ